ncbi:MAG: hypothetical protein Q9N34_05335 [Aquificota bacterium]|nr:hypothetical protein [Aquificota bacterium]
MGSIANIKEREEILKKRYINNYMVLKERAPTIIDKINRRTEGIDWRVVLGSDGSINAIINGTHLCILRIPKGSP